MSFIEVPDTLSLKSSRLLNNGKLRISNLKYYIEKLPFMVETYPSKYGNIELCYICLLSYILLIMDSVIEFPPKCITQLNTSSMLSMVDTIERYCKAESNKYINFLLDQCIRVCVFGICHLNKVPSVTIKNSKHYLVNIKLNTEQTNILSAHLAYLNNGNIRGMLM